MEMLRIYYWGAYRKPIKKKCRIGIYMKMLVDYKYNTYRLIVLTFIVTALYDVALRELSLYNLIPSVKAFFPFIQYLEPYFMKHTMLAAALIAGFVGATTQVILLYFISLYSVVVIIVCCYTCSRHCRTV